MIRSLALFFISAAAFSAACGGRGLETETSEVTTADRRPANANAVSRDEPVSDENNATNAKAGPVNSNNSPRVKRSDALRQAASEQPRQPVDIEAVLKQSTRPAPEDSEFAVALTDIVVERRTFNRHAILARVEKVTEGERSTIYVFTKDGSRRELPGSSIPSLSTAPSAVILQAIGLGPQRPRVSGSKPKADEKN